jgi:hypothetical protein
MGDALMMMTMMGIRIMRMGMRQPGVLMAMGMRLAWRIAG